ncbi:MAG: SUMF1/EgtB/PvdO family nonheme iron enzyme [Planctomycetota bacterium]
MLRRSLTPLALCLALAAPSALAPPAFAQSDKAIGVEQVQEAVESLPAGWRVPGRYALVVGADDYADDRISDLPACANDARGIYETLIDPAVGMFDPQHVTLLVGQDVTDDNVIDGLDRLGREAGPDDLVVVFFSGHGAVDPRGRSYWVMHDTRIDRLRATGLPENEITDLIADIRSSRVVTLIDACYSASTAQIDGQSKSLLDLGSLYPKFDGQGRVAITASQGDELSVVIAEGQPGHGYSAFAWHAIEGLRGKADGAAGGNREGVITVDELWTYVKDRTETTARRSGGQQRPQLKGQMGSRFMLTVDGDRLVAGRQETQQRLKGLQRLFLDKSITAAQYAQAERLLSTDPAKLDAADRKRRAIYADLAEGRLAPTYLQGALDNVETPEQRAVRLAEEARERLRLEREAKEIERKAQIAELLASARGNDSEATGRTALRTLDELLRLDPNHGEARRLRDKIAGYYGPSKVGETLTNSLGMKLAYIPSGEFVMGSPASEEGRLDDEGQHRVRMTRPFLLGTTEVTQGQWRSVMVNNPSQFKGDNLPVEIVSHDDATEFCRRLSQKEGKPYRLPTEAEWEYACRAGTTSSFSFGLTISTDQSNYNGNFTYGAGRKGVFREKTMPVGSFQPNAWGLYDMHGNVWELCSDWYGDYPEGAVSDPQGPNSGDERVLRGGSWLFPPIDSRSANRISFKPDFRYIFGAGFRVALDLQ